MKKVAIILFGSLLGSIASAGVVIDDFSDGPTAVETNLSTPVAYDDSAATVLGSTRWLGQVYSGPDKRSAAAVADGSFNVSTPFGATTSTALAYGNITGAATGYSDPNWFVSTGSANLDAGDDMLRLNFLGNEQSLTVDVVILTDGAYTFYTKTVAGGQFSPFSVDFTAADLIFDGGASLTSLDSLYIKFTSTNSGDFELGSVEAVPEPATMLVLGLGAAAMLRRRKKA